MSLRKAAIELGARAVAHVAGDGELAKSIAGAATSQAARSVLGKAMRAGEAIRARVERDSVEGGQEQTAQTRQGDPIDALARKAAQEPTNSGLLAMYASFRAGIRDESATIAQTPVDPTDPVHRANQAMRSTSLVVLRKAGDLAEMATPQAPKGLTATMRVAAGTATGSDVAYLIGGLHTWKGFAGGTGKSGALKFLLGRMGTPDAEVFEALRAFSNNNVERNKALKTISTELRTRPVKQIAELVTAEVVKAVLSGFNYTDARPDYNAREKALTTIAPLICGGTEAAKVVGEYAEDDSSRMKALKIVTRDHQSYTAAEIAAFMTAYPSERVHKLLRPKLSDLENAAICDGLLPQKKKLTDGLAELRELHRIGTAASTAASSAADIASNAFGSFWAGLQKRDN